MSDPASTDSVHLIKVSVEIDSDEYNLMVVTDDPSFWFANSMGQAVALSIMEHFHGKPEGEDDLEV